MLLSVKDRLILLGTLANTQGNLTELRIIRELREGLSFSEEEHAQLNIRTEGERMMWDDSAPPKEVEIGEVARRIIVKRLRELNSQGQLTDDHLDIIGQFPEVEA